MTMRYLVSALLVLASACGGDKESKLSLDQATIDRVSAWTSKMCACMNLAETQLAKETCVTETEKTFAIKWPNEFDLDEGSRKKFKDARREGLRCQDTVFGTTRNAY